MKLTICLAVLAVCAATDSRRRTSRGQYGAYWPGKAHYGDRYHGDHYHRRHYQHDVDSSVMHRDQYRPRHRLDDYSSERGQDRRQHPSLRRRYPAEWNDNDNSAETSGIPQSVADSDERQHNTGRRHHGLSRNGVHWPGQVQSGHRHLDSSQVAALRDHIAGPHSDFRRRLPTELTRDEAESGGFRKVDDSGDRDDNSGDDSGELHSSHRGQTGRSHIGQSPDGTFWSGASTQLRHRPRGRTFHRRSQREFRHRHPAVLTDNTSNERNFDGFRSVEDAGEHRDVGGDNSGERHDIGRDNSGEHRAYTGSRYPGVSQHGTFWPGRFQRGRRQFGLSQDGTYWSRRTEHGQHRSSLGGRHSTEVSDDSNEDNFNRLHAADDSDERPSADDHDSRERVSHFSSGNRRAKMRLRALYGL